MNSRVKCTRLTRISKKTLRGLVELELTPPGLVISECCWHESHGREWISFPAREYRGSDGVTRWQSLIKFVAPEGSPEREQFQTAAIAAIRDFVGEAAP